MRWSKLFIPTLREEPSEEPTRLRLLMRAGYLRDEGMLFLGQRALKKIAAHLRAELDAMGGQEIDTRNPDAMGQVARGELRSYRQLPQLWYQMHGSLLAATGFDVVATTLRTAIGRALLRCGVRATVDDPEGDLAPEPFHTPGVKTIEDLAAFTGMLECSLIKSVVLRSGSDLILVLLRGDHSLSEKKLYLSGGVFEDVRPATAEEITAKFGANPGSLGPVGVHDIRVLADAVLRGRRNMICGANRDDYHLRFVTPGRDFEAEYFDLRTSVATPGDLGTPLIAADGTVFGGVQSKTAAFRVLNTSGVEVEPSETVAEIKLAAILVNVAESCRDVSGLVMPPTIAPFSVVFTPVNIKDDAQRTTAERLYEQALAAGCDALLDDRDERPGVKFKDAELIGIPWRVTVGKKLAEGKVEVLERRGMVQLETSVENAVAFVRERWDAY